MKRIFMFLFILTLSVTNTAQARIEIKESRDWKEFEFSMEELRESERNQGISYILSGALVTVGSIAGVSNTQDTSAKFIFGLSQSLGVAAIGYGALKLYEGHDYSSFYETVRASSLSLDQRNQLVSDFLRRERDRQTAIRRVEIATHLLAGALNLYAASRETDPTSKTVFQFFSGVSFAIAIGYSF